MTISITTLRFLQDHMDRARELLGRGIFVGPLAEDQAAEKTGGAGAMTTMTDHEWRLQQAAEGKAIYVPGKSVAEMQAGLKAAENARIPVVTMLAQTVDFLGSCHDKASGKPVPVAGWINELGLPEDATEDAAAAAFWRRAEGMAGQDRKA